MSISSSSDIIDIRDIIERVEELESEREALEESANEERDDDEQNEGLEAKAELESWDEDNKEELDTLNGLLEELAGNGGDHQWKGNWYPVTLISDSHFVDAMRDLVQDIGDMPKEIPSYLEINWEKTAENLQADYSSVEYEGTTYWYR